MAHRDVNSSAVANDLTVAVAGAGLIGMACAAELARRGARVHLLDAGPVARGASWAAAGMLAPAFEAAADPEIHPGLFDLCMQSAQLWPDFIEQLQPFATDSFDYDSPGAIACAPDDRMFAQLEALARACEVRGVSHDLLSGKEVRRLEPATSDGLVGGLLLPSDRQIDNWAVIGALLRLAKSRHVSIFENTALKVLDRDGDGWRINNELKVDRVVWCAGKASGDDISVNGRQMSLLSEGAIQPVKGQLVSLSPFKGAPGRVLRFGAGYIAPKSSRIIVGATSEWDVDDTVASQEAALDLIRKAARIAPGLEQAEIDMTWAGVRPGTSDHAPLIGWTDVPGVCVATGHYRNGILLAPITAQMVANTIIAASSNEGFGNEAFGAFSPQRLKKQTV